MGRDSFWAPFTWRTLVVSLLGGAEAGKGLGGARAEKGLKGSGGSLVLEPNQHNPRCTNYWAPLTRKQHQQEHRPQWLTESSGLMQHVKGRVGDCPGPVKKQRPDGMSHSGGSESVHRDISWVDIRVATGCVCVL